VRAIVVLAVALVAAAALSAGASATYPDRQWENVLTLKAGQLPREVNIVLQTTGDYVRYDWKSNGPEVQWDIHSHPSSGPVKTWITGNESEHADVFSAPNPGAYSFFFRALKSDAQVTIELSGPFKFLDEPDPVPEKKGIPGPGAAFTVLAAAVALGLAWARRR
jgi:hypothetical protein